MKNVKSKEIKNFVGKKVKLLGYVHDVRLLGKINFLILRDREGKVQVIVNKEKVPEETFELVKKLHQEDVVVVYGKVVKSEVERTEFEIVPEKIEVVNKAHTPLPLDPRWVTPANLETRLEWRPLDLRRRENFAIFKIQSKIIEASEEFLRKKGFIQVFTPAIIGGVSEGGAEVFKLDFFGKEAFLRQDPQLHRQLLILAGFEKIFEIGPNWRAEPSDTPYHLAEHRGIAPEFIVKDERDVMKLEEDLVRKIVEKVKKECEDELKVLNKEVEVPRKKFPELKFPHIYEILEEMGKKLPFGSDLDRESEKILYKYVKEKYNHDFFFINKFPSKTKPFYVMRDDEDPEWARSVDLIFKGVEQSSGGQREHRYEKLVKQIEEKNLKVENLKWFVEHFKYGAPPHGGFCLGLERFTMQLLDINNIKEVVLFPRYTSRFLP